MITGLTILIAINCVLLMAVVLIQNPKGGGVDSNFGGAAANQMFGAAKSTDFVEKITWILAAILFVLCIVTAMMVSGTTGGAETIQDLQ
ncbi:MAG: preprotein translocase subunit SecG [Saprospiraceae bacterium]|nr:preprotein translocase subunit SecG [Saprospiraceae bacterium]MBK6563808.1 preprotein translocase subunit SecG [Saprospiraceae bacterium]MBK6785767.1 preprotein translocase subunit SecG [Saprospiraceae bacterium]MBK7525428.1 preprotein translocase subunit SecG [Saprospiraceae bacterium]MBK8082004.1 preprotein translocase subunit SecG [Saprospiraceae bacterium]